MPFTLRSVRSRVASTCGGPRIGVIRGATIIAPMTVAVESPMTPDVAMTDASTSRVQKRVDERLLHSRSMNSELVIRETSASAMAAMVTPSCLEPKSCRAQQWQGPATRRPSDR